MKGINDTIRKLLDHYANELDDKAMIDILKKDAINSEDEAKSVVTFLDNFCDRVREDAESGVVVLNQIVHIADAEKVCEVMNHYVASAGYEYLLE